MSTVIRAELSKKNKYWMERDRYYELKHFCMQYPRWKEAYNILCNDLQSTNINNMGIKGSGYDSTSESAILAMSYSNKIRMVEDAAKETDTELCDYILKAVTLNIPFTTLKMMYDIPCGKDMFYDRYRKFFYILDKVRK